MAESACLRRSLSNPTDTSLDYSEIGVEVSSFEFEALTMILQPSNVGNPIHALGDSISFGRYMSETLAWEKWSTFSHNRYLEEAEKSSKPGSVAKMKAYFEAHYRKKQAALEQVNEDISCVEPNVEEIHDVELVSSSSSSSSSLALNPETVFSNNHSIVNELRRSLSSPILHLETALPDSDPKKDSPLVEPLLSVNASSCDSSMQIKEGEKEEANIVESHVSIDCKDCTPEVQVYEHVDAEVNVRSTESISQTEVIPPRDIIPITPEKDSTIEKEAKKDKLDPRSKRKPVDMSLKSSKKSNMSKLSSSLARLATPVRPKMEGSGTHHKLARESVEKKKPTSKSVQASIDVNSDAKLLKKPSPASHKTGNGKAFTPLGKIIRQSFAHSPAPSTSRASVNSVPRHPSATPQSETRRSRIALEKSFSRNQTDPKMQSPGQKKMQSPSVGHVKPSAQSPITFSPFSFRTEERAVKRREFFERRLEKEAENLQLLENAKAKTRANFRKTSQSVNFSNVAVDIRREVLSDKTKIPIARPQPPKCESKPSTNLTRGKCSQPPRSSVGPKFASGNNKPIPVTLPTKKRHENASPNIL